MHQDSSAAQTYLRPTGFVDGPLVDPSARQLAGGLCWFALVEIIVRQGQRQVVPTAALSELLPKLGARAAAQWQALTSPRGPLPTGARPLSLTQPRVMGIVNITPDSFSDGGLALAAADAISLACSHATHGVDIIDLGAESTRPGARPVWEGDEQTRLRPVLEGLRSEGLRLSLDTRHASTMRMGLSYDIAIINDVSALLHDPGSLALMAASACPVVLMHAQGDPQTMQRAPDYADVLLDVYDWLEARIDACIAAGISRDRIILDPGIGFGKSLRHNLDLLNGISLFHGLGCPLLLGASRKNFIGALAKEEVAEQRLGGSLAVAVHAAAQGVQLLRVHDVRDTVQALRLWAGLRHGALTATPIDR